MKKIKEYLAKKKEQTQKQSDIRLKSEFKVEERNGFIWLTHDNVAFMKIPAMLNAERIAEMLNEARKCAVEFEKL